ncbi:hypothetical protein SUGI_0366520 [Cryptomeria japonica]|nr:hypothetical protein SUGI_0366520 [Cryptomeria japonica]
MWSVSAISHRVRQLEKSFSLSPGFGSQRQREQGFSRADPDVAAELYGFANVGSQWLRVFCLARLSGLEHLDLSFNKLTGVVKLELLENLTGVQFLVMSNNKLTLNFSPAWNPSFRLQHLGLSGCNIGGVTPPFVSQQLDLQDMDLSYNNLTGNVPSWLWELPRLRELNLSDNHLEGHL